MPFTEVVVSGAASSFPDVVTSGAAEHHSQGAKTAQLLLSGVITHDRDWLVGILLVSRATRKLTLARNDFRIPDHSSRIAVRPWACSRANGKLPSDH